MTTTDEPVPDVDPGPTDTAPGRAGASPATSGGSGVPAAQATVARVRAAFASGRTRPLAWRQSQLEALRTLLHEREQDILDALSSDLGKPRVEGFLTDIGFVRSEVDLLAKNLPQWTRPETASTPLSLKPGQSKIVRAPLGVVLVLAPWNYPVQLALVPLAGALAAGNAAVLKPSELTPATSALLAKWVPAYLDPEAVAVVEGGPEETSELLDERFDHIFFTGSGRVGRLVAEKAARHLTPVTLELGGKSPAIVHRDANLEVAARRIAWGKFLNAGQTCVAPDYVLVDRSVEGEFLEHLATSIHAFFGEDPSRSPDFARIVSEGHARRLAAFLADGDIAVGGQVDPVNRYVAPTVLRNVALDAPVMQEEVFGPVLPVVAVDGVQEAIDIVNSGDTPLALYVFTENLSLADMVLDRTSSGGAGVNCTILHSTSPYLPFGGVGPSGYGAYHGRATFETFTHRRSVLTKSTSVDPPVAYPPYKGLKARVVKRML
jgi:aldehyde dehydrogenase (NAD+)